MNVYSCMYICIMVVNMVISKMNSNLNHYIDKNVYHKWKMSTNNQHKCMIWISIWFLNNFDWFLIILQNLTIKLNFSIICISIYWRQENVGFFTDSFYVSKQKSIKCTKKVIWLFIAFLSWILSLKYSWLSIVRTMHFQVFLA